MLSTGSFLRVPAGGSYYDRMKYRASPLEADRWKAYRIGSGFPQTAATAVQYLLERGLAISMATPG